MKPNQIKTDQIKLTYHFFFSLNDTSYEAFEQIIVILMGFFGTFYK